MKSTLFPARNAVHGEALDGTWADLVNCLRDEPEETITKDGSAFVFAEIKPDAEGKRRHKKDQVVAVHALGLDFDEITDEIAVDTLESIKARGLELAGWPTWSFLAKPEGGLRFRLVLPLSRPVAGEDWSRFWLAAVKHLRVAALVDQSCKDASRLYFHTVPVGKRAEFVECCGLFRNEGSALDVDAVLASAPASAPQHKADDGERPDLNARGVIDGGFRVPRCPVGASSFTHAETLCRDMPAAISGSGGHITTLRLARALVWGLQLPPEQAVKLMAELYNARCEPPWTDYELAHKVEDASKDAGAVYPMGALLPPAPDSFEHLPLIVQRERTYWMRKPDSPDYSVRSKESDLIVNVRETFGAEELATWQDTERPIGKTAIERKSMPVRALVSCYYVPRTTFEPESYTLTDGLRTDEKLRPLFNEHVDAWLKAFAGPDVEALRQWISGCRPDRLNAPSQALGVVGPKEVGKSLIAHAIARIWGDPCPPVKAAALVSKFNGELTRCPIVLADEQMPAGMTGEDFREQIAARDHSVEPKGKEIQRLRGAVRFVATANNPEKILKLDGEKCEDDLQAIADRWRMVEIAPERAAACVAALQPLRKDGSNVDLAIVAQHFLWLQDNVEPHSGRRFVGAPPDPKILAKLRVAEVARTSPEVFDLLAEYFECRGAWDERYRYAGNVVIPKRGDPQPEARTNFPIVVKEASLFVRPSVLAQMLGQTTAETHRALNPYLSGARKPLRFGSNIVNAYPLDWTRLEDIDDDAATDTLAVDTSERMKTTS